MKLVWHCCERSDNDCSGLISFNDATSICFLYRIAIFSEWFELLLVSSTFIRVSKANERNINRVSQPFLSFRSTKLTEILTDEIHSKLLSWNLITCSTDAVFLNLYVTICSKLFKVVRFWVSTTFYHESLSQKLMIVLKINHASRKVEKHCGHTSSRCFNLPRKL